MRYVLFFALVLSPTVGWARLDLYAGRLRPHRLSLDTFRG